MSETWQEGDRIYYGRRNPPNLQAQDPGSMYCWACALAALAGVNLGAIAIDAPLQQMIEGQETVETRQLVEQVNRQRAIGGRLREPARWYSKDWQADTLLQNFPCALACDQHFLMVLAIGRKNQQPDGTNDQVRYWDPADAQVHQTDIKTFQANWRPAFSITYG